MKRVEKGWWCFGNGRGGGAFRPERIVVVMNRKSERGARAEFTLCREYKEKFSAERRWSVRAAAPSKMERYEADTKFHFLVEGVAKVATYPPAPRPPALSRTHIYIPAVERGTIYSLHVCRM